MCKKFLIALCLVLVMFGTANAEVQTIELKLGFNFISFSVKPSVTPQQLKSQYLSIVDIYAYSSAAGSFLSLEEGTLTSFNTWKGYIIKVNSSISMSISGEQLQTFDNINLKSGFNLVGISRIAESLSFSALMRKYYEIKGVYKWSNSAGSFIQVVKNSNNEPEFIDGIDPNVTIGQAYFVNVSKDCIINVSSGQSSEIIESQQKSVSLAGGRISFNNGIALNIPASSVISPSEVTVSLVKDGIHNVEYQNVLNITMNSTFKSYDIEVPVKSGMKLKDITAILLSNDKTDFIPLPVKIDELRQIYSVNIAESLAPIMKSPRYNIGNAPLIVKNAIIIETHDPLKWSIQTLDHINGIYEKILPMPKYGQENEMACWAAAMMMFIKAYNSSPNEKTVYNLLKKFEVEKNIGLKNVEMDYSPYEQLIDNEIITNTGATAVDKPVWYNSENLNDYVIKEILGGRPVLLFMPSHTVVVAGFQSQKKGTEPETIKYILNNPAAPQRFGSIGDNHFPSDYVSYEELNAMGAGKNSINKMPMSAFKPMTIKKALNPNRPLQTIQMPDFNNVSFLNNNRIIESINWSNKGSEGYAFVNRPQDSEVSSFDIIKLISPIYNSFPYSKITVKTRTSVSISGKEIYQYPPKNSSIIPDAFEFTFNNDQYNNSNNSTYFSHSIAIAKFETGWEKLGSAFLVKVELLNSDGNVIDWFDFKFKYRSLFIVPDSPVNTNELKAPSTLNFIAKLVDGVILSSDLFTWSVEPADGKVIINNGSVNISTGASGKYVVKTKYKENVSVHAGKEALYEIIVSSGLPQQGGKLTITPENPILYAGEELTYTANLSGLPSSEKIYYKWLCTAYYWDEGGSFSSDGPNCTYKAPNEAAGGILRVYAKIGKDFSGPDDWTADYLVETNITVKKPGITVLPNPISLGINERVKFTATVTDNVKNYPITWQLDNSLKGNISSDGYYDAPSSLASSKPETNIVIAKIGNFEDRANITINNVEIKIQQPVLLMPNSVFSFSALAEGAYNKDVEVTVSEGTVTKKAPMSFEFTSPKYNELFYDGDAHINVTVKSEATKVEKTVVFIVARPRRKEIIEYYPGNINIKEKYEAIVLNELQFDNTIVEKFWFKHGFYEKYNTAGKTIIEGNYYLAKVSGKWTTYQDNGSIIDITTYKPDGGIDLYGNGIKHGYFAQYYDSGRIKLEGNYTDNNINNEWKYYYDTVNDNSVHRLKESGSYNNGLKTGIWGEWHEDGQKKSEGEYKIYTDNTGVLVFGENGTWTKWYPDQLHHLNSIATYKNGVLDGPYTYWIGDNIYMKGNYTNGQKTGTWLEDTQTKIY